jgi:hypothetical protein
LVILGHVVDQFVEEISPEPNDIAPLYGTNSIVQIDEYYATNSEYGLENVRINSKSVAELEVYQTGAKSDPSSIIEDAPLLKMNTTYVLFLRNNGAGSYTAVGERLGIAEVKDKEVHFTNNEAKGIMSDFEGVEQAKVLPELEKTIKSEKLKLIADPEVKIAKNKKVVEMKNAKISDSK